MVNQIDQIDDMDRDLFHGSFAAQAMRDSRYHNTAYAIAELIDNSIDAEAGTVELLCMEKPNMGATRDQRRLSRLAVLDNGKGMEARTLLDALKFGGGTRHSHLRGIGKYGMGLPTSSMSQCKRVDVWTWQSGPDSVIHSSLDVEEIAAGMNQVPYPDADTPIPNQWLIAGSDEIYHNKSGTLIVWSELDKIKWKRARTLIENTSREVGRIHRHVIADDIIRIRTVSFLRNRPSDPDQDDYVVANDPLYLMSPTSVPEKPWDTEPMFERWGEPNYYKVEVDGKEETIVVDYSIVKQAALSIERRTQNPGATPRGRHARHNIGVSVVREGREIVLEDAFLREGGSSENPQNRWWGCEVRFNRNCDDLFGVDHNKQMVAHFTEAAKTLREERSNQAILDEMDLDDDPIYEIVGDIRNRTRSMMDAIQNMFDQMRGKPTRGSKQERESPENKAVRTATDADKDAIDAGTEKRTQTDIDRESIPSEEREAGLRDQFKKFGKSEEQAREFAQMLVREGLSYQFNPALLDGSLIFNTRSIQGVLHINLNTEHPVYDLISNIEGRLEDSTDELDPAYQAVVAIRLLLASWARMEDQTELDSERRQLQNIVMDWGRHAEKVINHLRDRGR